MKSLSVTVTELQRRGPTPGVRPCQEDQRHPCWGLNGCDEEGEGQSRGRRRDRVLSPGKPVGRPAMALAAAGGPAPHREQGGRHAAFGTVRSRAASVARRAVRLLSRRMCARYYTSVPLVWSPGCLASVAWRVATRQCPLPSRTVGRQGKIDTVVLVG
jgi:hypothetical protein